jgi:hypothetical protein
MHCVAANSAGFLPVRVKDNKMTGVAAFGAACFLSACWWVLVATVLLVGSLFGLVHGLCAIC